MKPSKDDLVDCLKNCGVPPEMRKEILACEECRSRQLCLLGQERSILLEKLHQAQRRIDLMDLLIASLNDRHGHKE